MKNILAFLFLLPCSLWANVDSLLQVAVDKLYTYHLVASPEKVYVHSDRSTFLPGETMWFKGYRSIASEHMNASGVVYVELANEDGVVLSQKYQIKDNCFHGDMLLPDSLPAGDYLFRAYTQWMRNFGEQNFFQCTIHLLPSEGKDATRKVSSRKQELSLQLFPEGGNLVEGIRSKVAFLITDQTGKSIAGSGELLDKQGNTVQTFTSDHEGYGSFSFTPEKGQRYYYRLGVLGKKHQLKTIVPKGFVMNVVPARENLRVVIMRSEQPELKDASLYLAIHQEGEMIFLNSVEITDNNMLTLTLPVDKLPDGLFTLSLFDDKSHVYAERLAFLKYPDAAQLVVETDKPTYKPREKVTLAVDVKDTEGFPLKGDFSMAITKSALDSDRGRQNYYTYTHLSSEVKGLINNPSQYFDRNDPEALSKLDLVLLTQGWRRYSFDNVLDIGNLDYAYLSEPNLSVSGKVVPLSKRNNKPESIIVSLMLEQDTVRYFDPVSLDKDYRFYISGMDIKGDFNLLMKAEDTKKNVLEIELDKVISGPAVSFTPVDMTTKESRIVDDTPLVAEIRLSKHLNTVKNIDEGVHELGEVVVRGRRYKELPYQVNRRHSVGAISSYYEVDPKRTYGSGDLLGILRQVPGVLVGGTSAKPSVRIFGLGNDMANGRGPIFVLNGQQTGLDFLISYPSNLIERIEILKGPSAILYAREGPLIGVIAIYTRRHDAAYREEFKGIQMLYAGYNQTKEFYSPNYEQPETDYSQPDLRNTLYWNPSITTDKEGKAIVSFYTSDDKAQYIIHFEGRTENGLIGSFQAEFR